VPNLLAAQFSLLIALFIRYTSQNARFLVPAGSIHVAMANHIVLPVLPFAIAIAVAAVIEQANPGGRFQSWKLCGAAALIFFFAGVNWLLLVRGRRRGDFSFAVTLSWLVALFLFVGGVGFQSLSQLNQDAILSYHAKPILGQDFLLAILDCESSYLRLLSLLALPCLLLWPRLCQSIHERHLSKIPRHQLARVG